MYKGSPLNKQLNRVEKKIDSIISWQAEQDKKALSAKGLVGVTHDGCYYEVDEVALLDLLNGNEDGGND